MMLNIKHKMTTVFGQTHNLVKRYSKAKDGTATIEFVVIAPLLIFLYIGLYEISIAFTIDGTVNNSSQIASSFPTFEENLDEVKLANIMTASAAVLDYPNFDINNVAIDIYSIEQTGDTSNTRRLVGHAAYEGSNATGILPDLGINDFQSQNSTLTAGKGFIVAQVAYRYEPTISSRYVQAITLSDRKTFDPRKNQAASLNFTTTAGEERAILNCMPSSSGLFSCSFTGQLPDT